MVMFHIIAQTIYERKLAPLSPFPQHVPHCPHPCAGLSSESISLVVAFGVVFFSFESIYNEIIIVFVFPIFSNYFAWRNALKVHQFFTQEADLPLKKSNMQD